MQRLILVIGVLVVGRFGSLSRAIEPANPDLIAEARAVLDYFAFHREIAGIAGNQFLRVMLEALRDHICSFLLHYVRAHGDAQSVIDRHRPVLEAIADGEADRA